MAIVDPAGILVYYEKQDNTQLGSAEVAIQKARSATLFKRPTKAFQDTLAAGGDGLRFYSSRPPWQSKVASRSSWMVKLSAPSVSRVALRSRTASAPRQALMRCNSEQEQWVFATWHFG